MRTDQWKATLAILALATSLVLPACAKKPTTPPTPGAGTTTPGATKISAAMVTDTGGVNDKSFNEAAWNGLQRLEKDRGAKVKYVESKRQEEYEPNIGTLVDGGYNLIWGIGFLMGDSIHAASTKYPNQKFGLIDAEAAGNNVASILFKEHEGSFLMGVMAAKTTKSKKVGFVGGMDSLVIKRFEAGFKAGVQAIDPTIQVLTVYAGSFADPGKGKDVALNMINQGADVIYPAAGSTGEGSIEAAREKKVFAIGVDKDQNPLAPDTVISSMIKRVDLATYDYSIKAAEGGFVGGQSIFLGLKEDGVGYSSTTRWDLMPAGIKELVDKWATAIKDGKVTVPGDLEALKTFTAPTI